MRGKRPAKYRGAYVDNKRSRAASALLVVLTERAVNIGLIRLEMKTAAEKLRQQQDARVSVETA